MAKRGPKKKKTERNVNTEEATPPKKTSFRGRVKTVRKYKPRY